MHQGQVEFRFGDGCSHLLDAGGVVRVDATMHRAMRNTGSEDAIIVIAGGKEGYVGRDGVAVEDSQGDGPPGA